jgi:heme/copper-type cytochrome/quinol oxidase subunit 4
MVLFVAVNISVQFVFYFHLSNRGTNQISLNSMVDVNQIILSVTLQKKKNKYYILTHRSVKCY